MLAAYFIRTDAADQQSSIEGYAGVSGDHRFVSAKAENPILAAGGGTAELSQFAGFAQAERAVQVQNLIAPFAAVYIPTVEWASQIANIVSTSSTPVAAGNFNDGDGGGAVGIFQLVDDIHDIDPDATFTFHGTMFLASYGAQTASGTGGVTVSQGLAASANQTHFYADYSDWATGDESGNGTWQASTNVSGDDENFDTGGSTLEQYVPFEIAGLHHGDEVDLAAGYIEAMLAQAIGDAGFASCQWEAAVAVWGSVTRDGDPNDLQEGDINGDGNVDEDDLQIWQDHAGISKLATIGGATYTEGDLNQDGFVDDSDLAILADALADHGIFIVSTESDVVDTNYSFGSPKPA